ncbi:MAG TPA: maleylpyruvate isomerase N-terminal domain-containing protein, partial [Thermomicrobiales bacterium]|nr:maleylpyruvate isomerase N-terminal domain-containing protein [Thermomicrobiales bacterium]
MTNDRTRDDEPERRGELAAPSEAGTAHPDVRVLMVEAAAAARPIIDNVRPEQWDARTCCTEWSVRQMVEHLIKGNEQTATALVGPTPPTSTVANDDLAVAFAASCERLQWAYAAPDALATTLDLPFGAVPAAMMARLR